MVSAKCAFQSQFCGYGHSTPSTIPGKIFTIFYAMVGIPLCLVLFHSIGERLNKVSSIVIKSIKKLLKCRNTDATEIDLILVVTTLSTITITSGAAVFRSYEGWTYFNSVYYCVITLTTIGFGDMVALQRENTLNEKPEYVAFALVFILFGMAIVAASLNLFVLRFVTMNTEDERRDEAEAQQVGGRPDIRRSLQSRLTDNRPEATHYHTSDTRDNKQPKCVAL
ncbi:two pore potassium channel protein sup-9-like [Penaeus japonicus]|uniref:two pore potassium channel protein sup-9-like n=1 Tax=Penaeus japonicus TaxID=27405 RepID=UPI001C711DB6|nr:two pore potassium channel protein sup-9-like [Penaeus japonicus]